MADEGGDEAADFDNRSEEVGTGVGDDTGTDMGLGVDKETEGVWKGTEEVGEGVEIDDKETVVGGKGVGKEVGKEEGGKLGSCKVGREIGVEEISEEFNIFTLGFKFIFCLNSLIAFIFFNFFFNYLKKIK